MTLKIPPGQSVTNNRVSSVQRGENHGHPSGSFIYDANGNLTWDGSQRYEYDPQNRLVATRSANDTSAPIKDQMAYDGAGERFLRVLYDPDSPGNPVTSYGYSIRSGAEMAAELEVNPVSGQALIRRAFLEEGGRLLGRVLQEYGSGALKAPGEAPASEEDVLELARAVKNPDLTPSASVPDLSEPAWSFPQGAGQADLSYAVQGLGDDVAWVEVRKSRIKNAQGAEDQVEARRLERPEGGWGAAPASFRGLVAGKVYRVALLFGSEAAGDLLLGPRAIQSQEEILVCPREASGPAPRRRWAWGDASDARGARWRVSAKAPQGYAVLGVTPSGTVPLGASASGEDVEVDLSDGSASGVTAVQVEPNGSARSPSLPSSTLLPPRWYTYRYFYVTDHLGTVRAIYSVLPSGGTYVLEPFTWDDYEPYGASAFPSYLMGNNRQFTGQERDQTTGNDYFHFRFYQSDLGRFMRPDNITGNALNPQSWNLYSYCQGNPINRNDPTGHMAELSAGQSLKYLMGFGNQEEDDGTRVNGFLQRDTIHVHLNVVIDQELSPEDQEAIKRKFIEEQLKDAEKVYGKCGIRLTASYVPGNVHGDVAKGRLSVLLSKDFQDLAQRGTAGGSDVDFKTNTGVVVLAMDRVITHNLIQENTFSHELGHVFGYKWEVTPTPKDLAWQAIKERASNFAADNLIDNKLNLIRYMPFGGLLYGGHFYNAAKPWSF